ncbi:hypothetical protein AB0M20_38630 [Actinoplanes sp. NPDC051633]|uniref:hypothetical protein n=1 Tax=Actinoplanes sp. NPDC051633 TaxID=3155670 RepID=UPI003429E231
MPVRPVLLVVALLFVALLTGAAHRGPPAPPVIVPARLGDTMFVTGDRVFVVSPGDELLDPPVTTKTVSAYALPDGRLLSRSTVAVFGAIYNVVEAGSVLLVSFQEQAFGAEATVALQPGTDRVLWRRPARLLAASAADGLVLLRENSPQVGNLNWFGVDMTSGALRWTLRQPVRGFTAGADFREGFPRTLISATADGAVEVRETRTGVVIAAARLPVREHPVGSDVPIWPSDDLLLVGVSNGTTAYSLPALQERWHSRADLTGRWLQPACGGAICSLSWEGGLWVLNPATGVLRWADERWNYADAAGAYLLAADNADSTGVGVISVLDPATGRVLGDFGKWQALGEPAADGTVIAQRKKTSDNIVWYARLDPATQGVRVLGKAERVAGDCQATTDVLICRRIEATVGIWSLK